MLLFFLVFCSTNIGSNDFFSVDFVNILNSTNINRHTLVVCERNGCLIHHTNIFLDGIFKRKYLVANSIRMFLGIFVINSVNLCGFHNSITLQFKCSQNCRRICRKKWISRTTHTNHDTSFFEMTKCAALDKIFRYLVRRNR